MRVYERAPLTTTRLGKDSTMSSNSQPSFPEVIPPPSGRRRPAPTRRKLTAVAVSCVAIGAGCILFLWVMSHKMQELKVGIRRATPVPLEELFCCAAFLESLSVDHNQSPCDDFQRYICPRNGTLPFRWNTWRAREALIHSRDYPKARSGKLLDTLRVQCEALLEYGPKQFVKEMTTAILRTTEVPHSANANQMLRFMAFISLKLQAKMPIHISIVGSFYPTVQVEVPLADLASTFSLFSYTCPECIDDVLSMVQNHTGNSTHRADFFAFVTNVTQHQDSGISACGPNLFRSLGVLVAWETLMRDIFETSIQQVRTVCADQPGLISAVFKNFATNDNLALTLSSVIVHALASIYQEIIANGASISAHNFENRCLLPAGFPNIWTNFYSEVVVTSSKNRHMRKLFARIITALKATASALLPLEEDAMAIHIRNLIPYFPYGTAPDDVTPPILSANFSQSFLLMKDYEYRLDMNWRHRRFPVWLMNDKAVYLSDPYVVVTPLAFALLDVQNKRKDLMNLPVVGVPMAKAMWSYLFQKENKWLNSILKSYSANTSCLPGNRENRSERKNMLETMLALQTALNTERTDLWNKFINASAHWQHVTLGHIFFLRMGNSLCDGRDSDIWRQLNIVLRQSSLFSGTFKCPDYFKANQSHCPNVVRSGAF